MTTLKFRAILSKDEIIYFTLHDLCDKRGYREALRPWLSAGNKPDVFIGLTDNSDPEVDIYSGDIIKVMGWGEDKGKVLGITAVVWDVDEDGWRYEDYGLVESHYYEFRIVEVIGNKTLNPEPLEA